MKLFLVLLVAALAAFAAAEPLPVVMWHGMGDYANSPGSMMAIAKMVKENIGEDVYVKSLQFGATNGKDQENGFFMPIKEQIQSACEQLKADPKLANGFNAMGFSQGGQFLRAYVQECNEPKMHNLITFGGQHQGVYGMPHCTSTDHTLCEWMRKLLEVGAYVGFVQDRLVQAEYWHDPTHPAEYLAKNIWLPGVNNALANKNNKYKENLTSLNKFVMVKFTKDTMVIPRESEWFGFYKPGQDQELETLQESQLYKEDWLGLKEMDEAKKLVFLEADGDHLQFTEAFFVQNIVPYLK